MNYNNIYTVDWKKLARDLVKVEQRKKKLLAFLFALVAPVANLHNRFLQYRSNVQYRIRINYQVCYLERGLNDRWDAGQRRIRIVDAKQYNPLPLYLAIENKPVVLKTKQEGGGQVLYTKAETAQFTVDFLIQVPAAIPFDATAMSAYVQGLIVQCSTFQIQTV